MKARVIPGTLLFPWELRHSVWTVVRYQVDQKTKRTPYERTRGCRYESALVPFGEVVMAKVADCDKLRAGKLDSAWVKTVWLMRTTGITRPSSGEWALLVPQSSREWEGASDMKMQGPTKERKNSATDTHRHRSRWMRTRIQASSTITRRKTGQVA